MRLYNEMGQQIKHKGQLNVRDKVRAYPNGRNIYTVLKIAGNIARIKKVRTGSIYVVMYTKGNGWRW